MLEGRASRSGQRCPALPPKFTLKSLANVEFSLVMMTPICASGKERGEQAAGDDEAVVVLVGGAAGIEESEGVISPVSRVAGDGPAAEVGGAAVDEVVTRHAAEQLAGAPTRAWIWKPPWVADGVRAVGQEQAGGVALTSSCCDAAS